MTFSQFGGKNPTQGFLDLKIKEISFVPLLKAQESIFHSKMSAREKIISESHTKLL
jgi:hypothetical protein